MSRTKAKTRTKTRARAGARVKRVVREERVRAPLTLAQLCETALRLVDSEGLEALTMRRLASELDVGVMTLYGYVSDKENLLEGLAEYVLRGLPPVTDEAGWVAQLRAWFVALRRTLRAHPSMAHLFAHQLLSSRPALERFETQLEVLGRAGITGEQAVRLWVALLTHTLGFVLYEAPRLQEQATLGEDGRDERRARLLALPPERFPLLRAVVPHLLTTATDAQFELGLDCLLEGLRARFPG